MTTPGVFQPLPSTTTGQIWQLLDAFVMRIDPSQPPSQQVVWCTYFGGTDLDCPLHAAVDAQGNVTMVGVTMSSNLPISSPPGLQTTRAGAVDGFVARLDPTGTTLLYSTYFGGDADDWLCRVAIDGNGVVTASGVTSSQTLPRTTGTLWPTYRGGINDAMLVRIDPAAAAAQQLLWSTYVGGPGAEGQSWPQFFASIVSQWPGNLRRQGLVADQGEIWLATEAGAGAATTANAYQPASAGGADAYLVGISAAGSSPSVAMNLVHATYFGGADIDRPRALARHPQGGFVIAGISTSLNLPSTPNAFQTTQLGGTFGLPSDAFVCWLRPNPLVPPTNHLVYGTFVGGNGGEESTPSRRRTSSHSTACSRICPCCPEVRSAPPCPWPCPRAPTRSTETCSAHRRRATCSSA